MFCFWGKSWGMVRQGKGLGSRGMLGWRRSVAYLLRVGWCVGAGKSWRGAIGSDVGVLKSPERKMLEVVVSEDVAESDCVDW